MPSGSSLRKSAHERRAAKRTAPAAVPPPANLSDACAAYPRVRKGQAAPSSRQNARSARPKHWRQRLAVLSQARARRRADRRSCWVVGAAGDVAPPRLDGEVGEGTGKFAGQSCGMPGAGRRRVPTHESSGDQDREIAGQGHFRSRRRAVHPRGRRREALAADTERRRSSCRRWKAAR